MNTRYCIVALFLLAGPAWSAYGQSSLIVRLTAQARSGLLVSLKEGQAKRDGEDVLFRGVVRTQSIVPAGSVASADELPMRAFVLDLSAEADAEALRRAWAEQEGVAYVQPNYTYRVTAEPSFVSATPDPLADSLTHFSVIRVPEAWKTTAGNPTVRIGLIDTGVALEHPDLRDQVWVNPGEDLNHDGVASPDEYNGVDDDGNGYVDDLIGYDFVDRTASWEPGDYLLRDPDPRDDEAEGAGRGHGTSVAGVMSARRDNGEGIAGVAPGCRLVPLRAFGADGIGEDDDVAAAIIYAAQMKLDVINLSFGDVYYSPLLHEAIRYAVSQGTVVVASAGNLGGDDPHYPSDYPEVISVAWLVEDGSGIAARGAYGLGIDVGAPGSFVFTTLLPSSDEAGPFSEEAYYGRRSGSSLAAPMVSATAALLRSVDPGLSPASIQTIITASAQDIRGPGWDHQTGAGRLDVSSALRLALPSRIALTSPEHESGWAGVALPIMGSAVDPSFDSYSIYVSSDVDNPDASWERIAGPFATQRLEDTLAVWQTGSYSEGPYALRLAVTLRTGREVEDRRRVYLDRTPPVLTLHVRANALVADRHALAIDVETDDVTAMELRVTRAGTTDQVLSDRRARRHGLTWIDQSGRGGRLEFSLTATNASGLQQTLSGEHTIPPWKASAALFRAEPLGVPHGYLLPRATDFDRDGWPEIVLNRYQDGWVGDTLAIYEWDGTAFRAAERLVANVIPRDAGDSDGDGLLELLTQVGGATLVLEQDTETGYPTIPAYVDTTGLRNPFDPQAAFGTLITDLDQDGHGELLVHNTRAWRLLEYHNGQYEEVLRLSNPTSTGTAEITANEFQQPLAQVGDFDGDGRLDLLTGDGDGDWIVYEVRGNDRLEVAWTNETPRYNAGARFAAGDFNGDGVEDFVTYTQNWTQPTAANEREPDIGLYTVWSHTGDDDYEAAFRVAIPGTVSRHGAMTTTDFDGDGRDELILAHAPDLYVFAFDAFFQGTVLFHERPTSEGAASGVRSTAIVAHDFDGTQVPQLILAQADEHLYRYVYQGEAVVRPAPVWDSALSLDVSHVLLAWRAPFADSVTVYQGVDQGPLDRVATTTESSLTIPVEQESRYVLRAWFNGLQSPASETRTVRPHPPAVVEHVAYPDPQTVEVVFSEPLSEGLDRSRFRLSLYGMPESVLPSRSGRGVLVHVKGTVEETDTLRWHGVVDREGMPVGQTEVVLRFPPPDPPGLIVEEWTLTGPYELTLRFNEPLDPDWARNPANYALRPTGAVVSAVWRAEHPEDVTLRVEGRPVGPTGAETALEVIDMRGASGARLATEGAIVRVSQAALSLQDVYVYPNPYLAERHAPYVVIAGLPVRATVEVMSSLGTPVRALGEQEGLGGIQWDLRDEDGNLVPSGVYVIRVEAPDLKPVLRKAAVIR